MEDRILDCIQCDESFIHSVKEQARHARHGFDPPRRCPACRRHKVRVDEIALGRQAHRKTRDHRRSDHEEELSYR